MKIEEFADVIGVDIIITRHNNFNPVTGTPKDKCWTASLKYAEIKEGSILSSQSGRGKTPDEAINNYCEAISGERIILNAMSETRRQEYNVPADLTHTEATS